MPVLTRAALLSDDPFFHHCLRAFAQEVDARLREREIAANLSQASNFAIVVEPDATARLYLDCVDYSLEMVAKRAVEKGEAVWSNDIGDIYRGNLRHPKLRPDQHYVLCLRHDWKFLLVFDLTPEQRTDPAALEVTIGLGMRRLLFEQLYETMADENVLATMIARGWFPLQRADRRGVRRPQARHRQRLQPRSGRGDARLPVHARAMRPSTRTLVEEPPLRLPARAAYRRREPVRGRALHLVDQGRCSPRSRAYYASATCRVQSVAREWTRCFP